MLRKAVLVAAVALVLAGWLCNRHQHAPGPLDSGVSRWLADDRAARVTSLKYRVHFVVPDRRDQPVRGQLTATFALSDASSLPFDFAQPVERLLAVDANGHAVTPAIEHGHIVIPANRLNKGANEIRFVFLAGDESLNRSDDFMYTLFVPARASLAMPCFDQPDLKARWTIGAEVPAAWAVVSNGAETKRTTLHDRQDVAFAETQPLPTYLVALAAGQFEVETGERNGRTFHLFHRETDAAKTARNREVIFDLHAGSLAWLERYTGIPYPFGKFDIVLIPSFQFGGMEHPGAIYYNAGSLMLDESATQNQFLGRADTIAHETSHMWFGDLVTMRWFNDVWMKEVLASFMAAKIVNPSFPNVNHLLRFLSQNYPRVYDVDRTGGANPIRQELANLRDAGSLYGAIIYEKAPIVIRQLELLVGEDRFREGLRQYLRKFSFGNATWPDLVDILDAQTPADLKAWSHAWVDEPGRPSIATDLQVQNGKISRLAFRESDPRQRGLVWPEQLHVIVNSAGIDHAFDLTLNGATTELAEAVGLAAPAWVLPTGGGLGYGAFDLDPATRTFLSTSLPAIKDSLTRGAALVTLWESMLDGKIAAKVVTEALLDALPKETDELNISQLLEYLRSAFWRFTPADDRGELAPRIEAVLRDGLSRATTTSLKSAWFGSLRNVATSAPTLTWLERVWRHEESIPGLPLAEPDEADLALDLAVRNAPDANAILTTQLARFKNPDRKARFAFVMPAVSSDPAVRLTFFDSLKDVKNRRHEAWVLDGMRFLHHPLRAAESKKLVRPALDLVWEIQRTGDIFFPKRWADATLNGYQSIQTAADVRAFINQLPANYPPRLRWVLLASADPLFRAARLLNSP